MVLNDIQPLGKVIIFMLVLAGFAGGQTEAQQLAHTQFIPVVARAPGAGNTLWISDLTLHNATESELIVGTLFLPADQANAFNPAFPDRVTLQPRETLVVEDVLNTLFDYETSIKGSLLLTADPVLISGNPAGALILATTRTYNTGSPDGTYGQTIPALSLAINPYGSPSIVTGARNDSLFRSNLGIVNMSVISSITVFYRAMDTTGAVVREGSKELQPASMSQWSFSELGIPAAEGALTLELWMDPDDVFPDPCVVAFANMFIAYVSKVDGNPDGTGDAEFIYAAPTRPFDCSK